MPFVKYVGKRHNKKDSVAGTGYVFEPGDVRVVNEYQQAVMCQHHDCWVATDESGTEINQPAAIKKQREYSTDPDIVAGQIPRIAGMKKSDMVVLAKTRYRMDLDPKMKAGQMRDQIRHWENGGHHNNR